MATEMNERQADREALRIKPPTTDGRPDASLTIADLVQLCAEHTERYLRHEPYTERFALELFRRAVVERDDLAWSAIHTQYGPVVRRWLGGELDTEVTAVFERFWQAVDAEKFARFSSLKAVLQYLKMCAQTTRIDRIRAMRSAAREKRLDDVSGMPGHDDPAGSVATRVDAAHFWSIVEGLLGNERECLVIYLSYVIGLTPREICLRHEPAFPEVSNVYRLKRNALERLGRAAEIWEFRCR